MPISTSEPNKFLITIAGPTGIGKSALAMEIARAYKAEIFSADSRQIYRLMDIGTAKPSLSELAEVKHHFIDHVDIDQLYTVGDYVLDCHEKLKTYFMTHDIAILVGGTGLYINSLHNGIDEFPDIPEHINHEVQVLFDTVGLSGLSDRLLELDPVYHGTVDLSNARRMQRAIAVSHYTGQPYSSFLGKKKPEMPYQCINILLTLDREQLYGQINQRVDAMFFDGLQKEVVSLYHLREHRALQTVGYQEVFELIEGKQSLNDTVEKVKQNTRRYAKRQMTWFRKYGIWDQYDVKDSMKILRTVKEIVNS